MRRTRRPPLAAGAGPTLTVLAGLILTGSTLAGCTSPPGRPTSSPSSSSSSYPPFPSTATRQFLADARTELPTDNDTALIAAAKRACTDLRNAPDWLPAARPLLADDVKGEQVGRFLHTAINAYCPDQTAKAPFLG